MSHSPYRLSEKASKDANSSSNSVLRMQLPRILTLVQSSSVHIVDKRATLQSQKLSVTELSATACRMRGSLADLTEIHIDLKRQLLESEPDRLIIATELGSLSDFAVCLEGEKTQFLELHGILGQQINSLLQAIETCNWTICETDSRITETRCYMQQLSDQLVDRLKILRQEARQSAIASETLTQSTKSLEILAAQLNNLEDYFQITVDQVSLKESSSGQVKRKGGQMSLTLTAIQRVKAARSAKTYDYALFLKEIQRGLRNCGTQLSDQMKLFGTQTECLRSLNLLKTLQKNLLSTIVTGMNDNYAPLTNWIERKIDLDLRLKSLRKYCLGAREVLQAKTNRLESVSGVILSEASIFRDLLTDTFDIQLVKAALLKEGISMDKCSTSIMSASQKVIVGRLAASAHASEKLAARADLRQKNKDIEAQSENLCALSESNRELQEQEFDRKQQEFADLSQKHQRVSYLSLELAVRQDSLRDNVALLHQTVESHQRMKLNLQGNHSRTSQALLANSLKTNLLAQMNDRLTAMKTIGIRGQAGRRPTAAARPGKRALLVKNLESSARRLAPEPCKILRIEQLLENIDTVKSNFYRDKKIRVVNKFKSRYVCVASVEWSRSYLLEILKQSLYIKNAIKKKQEILDW